MLDIVVTLGRVEETAIAVGKIRVARNVVVIDGIVAVILIIMD